MTRDPERYWNPYLAGLALGAVLLSTYLVMGKGLGASGASFRVGVWLTNAVAPAHASAVPAMAGAMEDHHPLNDWLVFEALKGPTFGTAGRIALAVVGGVVMGFAAKLARGCTSGQALSGGAVQSVGSWAFMLSVFAGGYAAAYLVRRQWR